MKNVILAPCEKVIIDKANGTPSLITIMQNISVQVPEGEPIPADAVSPKEWYIFSQWMIESEDYGKSLVQKATVVFADGKPFGEGSTVTFKLENREHTIAQNVVNLVGMPVGRPGALTARVWIEENGTRVTDISEYPMRVIHADRAKSEKPA